MLQAEHVEFRSDQASLSRVGFAALAVGTLALIWELLAHQAPYTTMAIPTLVAPVAQLRATAFTSGLIVLATAWAAVWACPGQPLPRWWVLGASSSVLASLAVLVVCAGANVVGLQLSDPQPGAPFFVYARLVTQLVAALFLLDFVRRVTFRRGS